jgi:Flp pilus assembly protein TadG
VRLNAPTRRSATTIVECALVYPLVFLLVLGLLVGGLGIFRYQEIAYLAREGARHASVRGMDYEIDMITRAATAKAITADQVRTHVRGLCHLLNPNDVQVTVTWQDQNSAYTVTSSTGQSRVSTVTVTVTYPWLPELFLVGPINLSSTCVIPMSY